MSGALLYIAERPGQYENWSRSIWRALKCGAGEDKMVRKLTNEQAPESIGEKRALLNNIIRRKAYWIMMPMKDR